MKLQHAIYAGLGFPCHIIKIKLRWRYGFIGHIQLCLLIHHQFACFVLIGNTVPSRKADRGNLIILSNRNIGHIIKERFQAIMKKWQPMLHTLIFAPSTYSFIKRIIRSSSPKFNAVILAKAGYGGLIQYDFGHR